MKTKTGGTMAEENKKLALLRILHILQKHSDENHPLKQDEILTYLNNDYGIELERKAVGRYISLLHEAYDEPDSPIVLVSDKRRGTYIQQREFEDSELRLLIDGVLSSKHIAKRHSKDLIDKLCNQSNKYFRPRVKNIYSVNDWYKTSNNSVFLNIEIVDEAINEGKQIKFVYNKYGADKKLHQSSNPRVSPYQLILHNQRYYLMAYHENFCAMLFYRLDRITDMKILDLPQKNIREIDGYKSGIDYKKISSALPYLYADKLVNVSFLTDEKIIDQVVDWFGTDIKIEPYGEKFKVSLFVSEVAMQFWALQYLNYVEILSPQSLRENVKNALIQGLNKYE